MKKIFIPTLPKILLSTIIIGLTAFIPKTIDICSMDQSGITCEQTLAEGIGYPLFYGTKYVGDVKTRGAYPLHFMINVVASYVLSSSMITIYRKAKMKIRKRNQH